MIRSASRLAYAFHAEFTALYVETPQMSGASLKNKKALEDNIQLAKALGAKIATVYGEDVAYQIAAYARGVKRIKNRPGKNESPDHPRADQRDPGGTGGAVRPQSGYLHHTRCDGGWKTACADDE